MPFTESEIQANGFGVRGSKPCGTDESTYTPCGTSHGVCLTSSIRLQTGTHPRVESDGSLCYVT